MAMIVTLTGPNDFLRKAELQKIVRDFVAEHTDMAVERFDGEETDAARMRESMSSLPFLTARKLVILYEPGKQKAFAEHISEAVKDVADTTDVIIVEPKLDKRLSYYKTLKKETDFRDFTELDAPGLLRWVSAYAKEQGGSLGVSEAKALLDRVGPNQQMLKQELDKLLIHDPHITRAAIEELVEAAPQSTVFELLDAAFSGNLAKTLALYREQRALKVEPQAIIALLAWQLHALALVKSAGNKSPEDIARQAKVNPYVVRKTQNQARGLTLEQVKRMVQDLLKLDLALKSSSLDADETTLLYLTKLTYRH